MWEQINEQENEQEKISLDDLNLAIDAMNKKSALLEIAEEEFNRLKKEVRQYKEEIIPQMMLSVGVKSLTTEDGKKVDIVDKYFANISKDRETLAYNWLDENGYDISKLELKINFSTDEADKAKVALNELRAKGFAPSLKRSIHAGTLKAFVKERIETGDESFPKDVFGVHQIQEIKVK
jgi:hypothetical protein